MTSRPSLSTKRRPLSAIFLGAANDSNTQLPDLPDPPSSPHSSSGLPSPPATNSTGSGSNGGDFCSRLGSIRIPSTSDAGAIMQNGSSSSSSGPRSASRVSSDEGDDGNDEDNTARLSADRRQVFHASTNDNQSALQRVKSLTQRNRLVLNKLASITSGSRLSTPSPPALTRLSRSPAPSSRSATSSRVSNTSTRQKRPESISRASGSETERENIPTTTSSPDEATPPSATTIPFRSDSVRERRVSAPDSPSKSLTRERSLGPSDSATLGRRTLRTESRNSGDIEAAALAAVANSRRRSPSDARRRQPLPREFRNERMSLDGRPTSALDPPLTPRKDYDRPSSGLIVGRAPTSPSSHVATIHDSPQSPNTREQRFSTVREMTRRHQTRWLSQDLSSPQKGGPDDVASRLQNRRGGSGDSPLAGLVGRSVVGEGLRAAGLTRRRDDSDDVFGGDSSQASTRQFRLSGDLGPRSSTVGRADPLRPSTRLSDTRPSTRLSDRAGASSSLAFADPRTPLNSAGPQRNAQTVMFARPSTSMAAYREEPRTAPPLLRTHKSAYPVGENERQPVFTAEEPGRASSTARNAFPTSSAAAQDRTHSSPSALVRHPPTTPLNLASAGSTASPDHTRIMLDSLNMFESQLARLPTMGNTTTSTIPELFRSAQNIVHSANALNTLLRNGTSHALEQQIDAEVDDGRPIDPVEIWRDVGGDYRESLRVSDELVRTMTSFLLGVGKLLRESMAERSHNRTSSLDETTSRRNTPELSLGIGRNQSDGSKLSSDGRSSIDAKRRWDSSSGDMAGASTAYTSLNSASSSASRQLPASSRPSTASKARAEADSPGLGADVLNDVVARKLSRLSLQTPRRTDSFRELRGGQSRESAPPMKTSFSEDAAQLAESPFGNDRVQSVGLRRATSLAVPPPLPSLPSESLLRSESTRIATRRAKMSTTSNATVRANSIFPSLASGNPTTAVTAMAVQASPERPSLTNTRSAINVRNTLSRTAGAAMAGLQQQIERDGRKRTISASSALEGEIRKVLSGNEAEDARRTIESRPRMSLDSNPGVSTMRTRNAATEAEGSGRERRDTMTSLFTRA